VLISSHRKLPRRSHACNPHGANIALPHPDTALVWLGSVMKGQTRRNHFLSAAPSIADDFLRRREPPLSANSRLMQCSKGSYLISIASSARASIVGGMVRPRIALLQGRANRDRPHWGTGISLRTQWQDERTRQPHLIFGKRTEVCVLYLVNTVLSEVAVVDCKR
jgi:hypothetical protein